MRKPACLLGGTGLRRTGPEGTRALPAALLMAVLLATALPTRGLAADPSDPPSGAEPAARAGSWRIGRSPEVFRDGGTATRVAGWLDASYQDNDIESESINLNHLNLVLDTRFQNRWQAFLEVEFENEPEVRGFEGEREYEVEQVYVRWIARDDVRVRLGQFNTPFGYWTPIHWSILMDTITEPIHEGTRVTPEQQVGLELAGQLFLKPRADRQTELRYSLFAGYGDDTEVFEESETDGLSFGGDVRLGFEERSFVGLSLYQQTREQKDARDRTERALMAYGEWHPLEPLTLRFEILRQLRDHNVAPGLSRRINIGYAKLRWDLSPTFYLNYRYNYGDDETLGTSDERHIHTVTLGFRSYSGVRVKLEYASNEFRGTDRRDFHYWGVSVGTVF